MRLDRRFCFIAIAFFITTIVLQGANGLIVPRRPSTNDDFAKKLNQISAFDQIPETGSFLDRKAHGRYQREVANQPRLQIYEADVETETISVRLTPLDLVLDGVDSYNVEIVTHGTVVHYQNRFAVSQELHCKLWDDALCLQNLSIRNITGWVVSGLKIKISGEKNGEKVAGKQWESDLQSLLPEKVEKDPSRRHHVEVVGENLRGFGTPAEDDFTTPGRIDFESSEILSIGPNGSWVQYRVPAVINVRVDTWVNVIVEGPLNCTKNESSVDQTIIRDRSLVGEHKVDEETPRYLNISENGVRDSESTCYLQPGRSYVIKAEGKDKVTNVSAVPIESIEITLLGGDGEASPTREGGTESYHLSEVKYI